MEVRIGSGLPFSWSCASLSIPYGSSSFLAAVTEEDVLVEEGVDIY